MNSAAEREAQACACLAAAEKYLPQLVAMGTALSGSKEAGMELYQQATLSCHDAIQAHGFQGDHYAFYLRRAIRNLHYRTVKEQQRHVTLVPEQATPTAEELPDEWQIDAVEQNRRQQWYAENAPDVAYTQLAEQVMEKVRQDFTFADRVALRLSLGGMSCQQIAEHIGTKDQSWVWRRLDRMKAHLRKLFQPHFDALGE